MGGCCSAEGTASGSPATSGAPLAKPADKRSPSSAAAAKAPSKSDDKKAPPTTAESAKSALAVSPPAAQTSKPSEPTAPPASDKKSPAEPPAEKNGEKSPVVPAKQSKERLPPVVAKPPAKEGPPAAQLDRQPNTTATAAPAERKLSPASKACPSLAKPDTPSPPTGADPAKAAVEFDLPPPPATQKALPVSLTPERVPPPDIILNSNGDGDDHTRGPSTARIEEVPPTPVRESDVATGKALAADDARVLQKVPPPPPPLLSTSSAQETPREELEREVEEKKEKEEEEGTKLAPPESNPLADILRREQEEKQRYPTALTTDAKNDAPLEIVIEVDKKSAALTRATNYPAADSEDFVGTMEEKRPLAEPGTVLAVSSPAGNAADDNDVPKRGRVFKVLLRQEWEELRNTGEFRGNATEVVSGCIRFWTADQAIEAAMSHPTDIAPCVLICCSIDALSKPARRAGDTTSSKAHHSGGPATLQWETEPLIGQRTPRLYRTLHRDPDILWSKECANGNEVAERLHEEVVISCSESVDEDKGEEPEKIAYESHADDLKNKPITFTDTSEIERELAEKSDTDNAKEEEMEVAPHVTQTAEQNHPAAAEVHGKQHSRVTAADNSQDEEGALASTKESEAKAKEDKPQPVAKAVLRDVMLAGPSGEAADVRPPTQHPVSAMHAPEAAPAKTQDGVSGDLDGLAAPRRVPPPLPSPPTEPIRATEKNLTAKDGEATPPPSRPAPTTILSPPPA